MVDFCLGLVFLVSWTHYKLLIYISILNQLMIARQLECYLDVQSHKKARWTNQILG